MPKAKLDWTPVDISASSRPMQQAYKDYITAREAMEAHVTKVLTAKKEVPAGMTVKIGLMFNKLSYTIVPVSGSNKSVAL